MLCLVRYQQLDQIQGLEKPFREVNLGLLLWAG